MQALLFIVIFVTLTEVYAVKFGTLSFEDAKKLGDAICDIRNDTNLGTIINHFKLVVLLTKEGPQKTGFAVGLFDAGDMSFTVQFDEVNENYGTTLSERWVIKTPDHIDLKNRAIAEQELRNKFNTVSRDGEMWVLIPRPNKYDQYAREPTAGRIIDISPLSNIEVVEEGFMHTNSIPVLEEAVNSSPEFQNSKHVNFDFVRFLTKKGANTLIGFCKFKDSQEFFTAQFSEAANGSSSSSNRKYTQVASVSHKLMDEVTAVIKLITEFVEFVDGAGDNLMLIPRNLNEKDFTPIETPAQLQDEQQPPINQQPPPPQPLQNANEGQGVGGQQAGLPLNQPQDGDVRDNLFVRLRQRNCLSSTCCAILCGVGTLTGIGGTITAFVYWVEPWAFGH